MVDEKRSDVIIKGKKGTYKLYSDQRLGKGGFADVYKGKRVSDGLEVAIKRIYKRIDYGKTEIALMEELSKDSKNVYTVKLLDYLITANGLFLILPFYKNGSLRDYVKVNGILKPEIAGGILLQLISALKYLHLDKKIMHRDLTSANVLIKDVTSDGIDVLLGDFGLAKNVDKEICKARQTTCGTPGYMPPEIEKGKYQPGDEVYSLGGILYYMLTGREPNPGCEEDQLKDVKDRRARYLIENLWKNAKNRPTLHGIDKFQFLNQYCSTIQKERSSSEQRSRQRSKSNCAHRLKDDNGRCQKCNTIVPRSYKPSGDSAYGSSNNASNRNTATKTEDRRRPSRTPSANSRKTKDDKPKKEYKWPLPSFEYFQSRDQIDETRIRNKLGRFVIVDPTTFVFEALSLNGKDVEYIYEVARTRKGQQKFLIYVPKNKNQQLPEIGDDLIQKKRLQETIISVGELGQHCWAYKKMYNAIEIFYSRNTKIYYRYVEGNSKHTAKLMYDGSFRFIFETNKIFVQKPDTKDGDFYSSSNAKLTEKEKDLLIKIRKDLLGVDQIFVNSRGNYYMPFVWYQRP